MILEVYSLVTLGVPDSSGFAIYRDTRKLHFVVNDGSSEWAVELNNQLPENIWKNIGFSWSQIEGLTVSSLPNQNLQFI